MEKIISLFSVLCNCRSLSTNKIPVYLVLPLLIIVSALLVLPGCGGDRDKPPVESIEKEELSLNDTEVKGVEYSGNLRVVSTDGSYIHEVVLIDSEGDVLARGDTGNPFPVPEGTFNIQVQGYTFPVTVERDKQTLVRVAEEMGLGKLKMITADGSYIHPVVVTDQEGNEVAEGRSGFYIDLAPGKYRASMGERTVDVEITKGETTYIRP